MYINNYLLELFLTSVLLPSPSLLQSPNTYFFPGSSLTVMKYCILLCKLQKMWHFGAADDCCFRRMSMWALGTIAWADLLREAKLYSRWILVAWEYYQHHFSKHTEGQSVHLTCVFWMLGLYWYLDMDVSRSFSPHWKAVPGRTNTG